MLENDLMNVFDSNAGVDASTSSVIDSKKVVGLDLSNFIPIDLVMNMFRDISASITNLYKLNESFIDNCKDGELDSFLATSDKPEVVEYRRCRNLKIDYNRMKLDDKSLNKLRDFYIELCSIVGVEPGVTLEVKNIEATYTILDYIHDLSRSVIERQLVNEGKIPANWYESNYDVYVSVVDDKEKQIRDNGKYIEYLLENGYKVKDLAEDIPSVVDSVEYYKLFDHCITQYDLYQQATSIASGDNDKYKNEESNPDTISFKINFNDINNVILESIDAREIMPLYFGFINILEISKSNIRVLD